MYIYPTQAHTLQTPGKINKVKLWSCLRWSQQSSFSLEYPKPYASAWQIWPLASWDILGRVTTAGLTEASYGLAVPDVTLHSFGKYLAAMPQLFLK